MTKKLETFKYTIKKSDDYSSLAKVIIGRDLNYNIDDTELLQEVQEGLKISLRDKLLFRGETVCLIDNVQYYTKVTRVKTVGQINGIEIRYICPRKDSKYTRVNYINKLSSHLFFNIREYKDYKCYAWCESGYNYEKEHGEIGKRGLIEGDKTQYEDVKDGYIYIFNNDDELVFTFQIKDGMYQEVRVDRSDCSHFKIVSPKRPCGMIYKFFNEDGYWKENYRFVYSQCKLSKARIFGDSKSIFPKLETKEIYRMSICSKDKIRSLNDDQRTGDMILYDFRKRLRSVHANYYHFRGTSFKGYNIGVSIYYPNPLKELERRAAIFQKRFKEKQAWLKEKSRAQQLFLYTTIKAMVEKDSSMEKYVSKERMHLWNRAYQDQLILYTHKEYYGVENLIDWFQSPELYQCMLNYLASDDMNDRFYAVDVYARALTYIDQTAKGREAFIEEIHNSDSIINYLYNIDGTKSISIHTTNPPIKTSLVGVLLKDNLFNQDDLGEGQAVVRKVRQSVLTLIDKSSPLVIKCLGSKCFLNLLSNACQTIADKVGKKLPVTIVKPLEELSITAKVIDTSKIKSYLCKSLQGKKLISYVSLFEAVNVAFMLKAVLSDEEHSKRNLACLAGAVFDFSASVLDNAVSRNLLFKTLGKSQWANCGVITGKIVPGLGVVSGMIDCMVGIDCAIESFRYGEIGVGTGFVLYGVGGGIVATGSLMQMVGYDATVAAFGTDIEITGLVIASGVLIEAIGLMVVWHWDNKAIKDWIDKSIFGDDPSLEDDYPDIFKGINEDKFIKNITFNDTPEKKNFDQEILTTITTKQIDTINEIMCEYRIEAKFNDTSLGTRVTIELTPGIITNNAEIRFSEMRAFGFRRNEEAHRERCVPYFDADKQYFKGEVKCDNPTICLANINNQLCVEKNAKGVITKIKQEFNFYKDIDRITGRVEIDFNNQTFQKFPRSKEIDEFASVYE